MAKHHLKIEKGIHDGRTSTNVTPLDFEGRVREIARIMGGDSPSSLILESAREELLREHPELSGEEGKEE